MILKRGLLALGTSLLLAGILLAQNNSPSRANTKSNANGGFA